ncbi:Metallo-dependent hydrolase [Earliella scabrosa]|nr:Metallo-dependent hydrolase [Earliella scabrosa]
MEEYLKQRRELIARDRALRRDNTLVEKLSPDELKADEVLRGIRSAEAKSVWSQQLDVEHMHGPQQMFPGMEFLTARETIVRTQVFDILSKMPKGGLLHAHLGATVRADVLLRLALKHKAMHVRTPGSLSTDNLKTLLPQFCALPIHERTEIASLTEAQYVPDTWVPIQNARNNFSEALGGPDGFDRWVISSLMINPSEAYGTHNTTSKIWQKFQSTMSVSGDIIAYLPVWKEYVREFLLSSVEDGISYVEPRVFFYVKYLRGEDGEENVPHRVWFQVFEQILTEVKSTLAAQGREDEFIGAKIIYSIMRDVSVAELEWYLDDCLALKQEFPHLLAGFDVVGHEDSLNPLLDFIQPFQRFRERQNEVGVDVPFMFHAGETLGDGSNADMNLYDAILLGTKRIGHGFSIYKHPHLMDLCREKGICLEMCPISNEILRLTGSMPMHPLPAIINHGVPVALCSDDPSVFGNMGLTFDFFQVFVASEVNGLHTLRQLVWDSIRFSGLDDDEKERAFGMLERRWAKFVTYVLDEHASSQNAP